MGYFEDNRKFKIKVHQSYPTNPHGCINLKNREFAVDKKTIDENEKDH